MPIKLIFCSLLIATQLSFATDNFELSEQERAQNKAYNQALYTFLRNNSSPKVQLIGYSTYLSGDEKDIKAIKQVLTKTINIESDEQILFLADKLCHSDEKLEVWCHKKQIHQIHQQVDPENIMTYVNALHDTKNDQKDFEWLDLVSRQSTYSNSFLFELSLVLSDQISIFNDKNPSLLPQNEQSDAELLTEITALRLIEKGLFSKNFIKDSKKALPYILATGIMMAQSISYRNFTIYCMDNLYFKQCQQVAKTLKTDKTFIGQLIANSISRKISGTTVPNRYGTKSYQKASCYSQSQEMIIAQMTNPVYAKQYLLDAIEFGEGQASENLAFKVYNTVREHGFNPDFNPKDCEKTLKGID